MGAEVRESDGEYRNAVRLEVEALAEGLTRVLFGDYDAVLAARTADPLFGNLAMLGNVVINSARNALREQARLAVAERARALEFYVERERLQALLDATDDGVVFLDVAGRVRSCSEAFLRLSGLTRAQLDDCDAAELAARLETLRPDPPDTFRRALLPADPGSAGQLVLGCTLHWPQRTEIRVLSVRLGGAAGAEHGRAVSIRDVTLIEDSRRFREELIGNVAHDLRTPLTSMLGFLELLANDALGPLLDAQRPAIEVALRNARRMSALLNDLLDVDRIRSGVARAVRVDLARVVGEAVDTQRAAAAAKGLDLRCESPATLPVDSDAQLVAQIVINLVSNAVKFTDRGTVVVRVVAGDPIVVIEVEDSGIGIPEVATARIFERYYRSDEPARREPRGAGVGLSIVQRFVDMLGGHVDVRSELGRGSRFRVTLPRHRAR